MQILRELYHAPAVPAADWLCPKCGEEVPGNFELCWQCGAFRPGQADHSEATNNV